MYRCQIVHDIKPKTSVLWAVLWSVQQFPASGGCLPWWLQSSLEYEVLHGHLCPHTFTRWPCSSAECHQTLSKWLGKSLSVWYVSEFGGESQFQVFCSIFRLCFKLCILSRDSQRYDPHMNIRSQQFFSRHMKHGLNGVSLTRNGLGFPIVPGGIHRTSALLFNAPLCTLSPGWGTAHPDGNIWP